MHSGVYFKRSQVRIEGPEKIYTRDAQEGRKNELSISARTAAALYIGVPTLGPTNTASQSAHLLIPIFHYRPSQSGRIESTPGSNYQMVSSIFGRVALSRSRCAP